MNSSTNRRQFLSDTFSAAGAFAVGGAFATLGARAAVGESARQPRTLVPVNDETTGLPLLKLPEGFRYQSFGWTGDMMSDGQVTPRMHDGMGVVASQDHLVYLCRNHEVDGPGTAFTFADGTPYDQQARGGCTQLVFDTKSGKFTESKGVISGTVRNCAGGITPWGTWLTCEETLAESADPSDPANYHRTHGWVFEVPTEGTATAQPLWDMGRFSHEAVAIDRETGIVYLTEDMNKSGFYRFIPRERKNMAAGGILEMAEAVGQADLRGGFVDGTVFPVRWHRIDNPRLEAVDGQPAASVYEQGRAQGGSTFSRLEGCWYGNGKIYFDATSGGAIQAGQIWMYDPAANTLTMLYESRDQRILNMPDNLCVNPQGGLILCEDNDYAGEAPLPQRVLTLSLDGHLAVLAENNIVLAGQVNGIRGTFRDKEWAGSTFSPDGKWLFVNIQTPGVTFAITGPWDDVLS